MVAGAESEEVVTHCFDGSVGRGRRVPVVRVVNGKGSLDTLTEPGVLGLQGNTSHSDTTGQRFHLGPEPYVVDFREYRGRSENF